MLDILWFIYDSTRDYYNYYRHDIYNYTMFPFRYIKYEYFKNDHSIIKYDRKRFLLTYKYNENIYKILIKHSNLPNTILCVLNHLDEDITEEFTQMLGPGFDFHGQDITPDFFNTNFIKIVYIDDKNKLFFTDDIIRI